MNQKKKLILILFGSLALLIILLAVLFAMIFLFLSAGIPLPVYQKYLEYAGRYNCGQGCSHKIEVCDIADSGKLDYIARGAYTGSSGEETHYLSNGTELCYFEWYAEMRDAEPDYYNMAGCPAVENCHVVLGY